jgi:hypothetical protein
MQERREVVKSGREQAARVVEVYEVLVECRDEEEQRELFERLRGEGLKVRLLVL